MKKPPPILTPRIIAEVRAGEEFGDPDHPGFRVRRTNAARVFFYRYRILNHIDSSVSAIYDRHRYDAEARVAAETGLITSTR